MLSAAEMTKSLRDRPRISAARASASRACRLTRTSSGMVLAEHETLDYYRPRHSLPMTPYNPQFAPRVREIRLTEAMVANSLTTS
jgi:hypothetical protein